MPTRGVFKRPNALVKRGCSVHSVCRSYGYVCQIFDLVRLQPGHRLHSFARCALALTQEDDLYEALSEELVKAATYVPRVVTHESKHSMHCTSFHVLSTSTLSFVIDESKSRILNDAECRPLLSAVQVVLLHEFELNFQLSRRLTRYVSVRSSKPQSHDTTNIVSL